MAEARSEQRFVDEVPRLLAQRGMSLRALARAVEVSPGYMSRVLRGRDNKSPSAELAERVALAFGLPRDYFPDFREAVVIRRIRGDARLREELYKRLD
jgi:transcriptional regulator with XRE-family HTH domain